MSFDQSSAPVAKTPGIVTTAFVLSILGFICGLPAIIGLILGLVGRPKAKAAGKGVGMATAAIIIGAGWLVLALILGIVAAATGGSTTSSSSSTVVEAPAVEAPPAQEPDVEIPVDEAPAEFEESDETVGEANARERAQSYLDYSAFSRKGLIEQLEFEGFTTAEATYGTDAVGADWEAQAALKAQSYLDYSSFSRSGLIEQLEFEGFSRAQATYGVNAVGL